jgi:AAA domain (dynein-related subfamily)
MDTRPEDLLITPVIAEDRRIEYRASSVVSAMIRGGVLLLDEGNRMPERSWASLAPLMDERRYVESTLGHQDSRPSRWLGGELDWALRCWPTPVGSNARDLIVPWIPGDSILEARRLARQLGIPVHLVDLTVVDVAGAEPPRERPVALLPGPEFAPRVGQAFQDAVDAVAEPPSTGDLAREAFMAERLDGADAPASPGAVGGRHGALDAARRTARTARFLQSAGAEAHTRPMPSSLARGLGIAPVDRALAISGRAVCRAPGVI